MTEQANTIKRSGIYLIEIDERYFEQLFSEWLHFTPAERQQERQAVVKNVNDYIKDWEKDLTMAYLGRINNTLQPAIKISPIDTNGNSI